MRTTLLLLLSLACCMHCFVDGASLHKNSHSKLAGHHPTHKREEGKIAHHRALTPLQKKSEHHVKVHHVTVDKKEASGLTAKTVNIEKVKRFLARILKSAEAVKHRPVHTQKVTGETKRHLKMVQKKRAASQKKRSGKIDAEKVKKALVERTAATGSETQTRRLLHTLLSRLASRRRLTKRQGGRGPPTGKPKPPPCEEGHPGYKPDGHPGHRRCRPKTTTTTEPSTTEASTVASTTTDESTTIAPLTGRRLRHVEGKEEEEKKKRGARKGRFDYDNSDEDNEDYSSEDYDDNDYETGTEEPHEDFHPEYDYDDLDFGDYIPDFGDDVPDFGDDVPDFGDGELDFGDYSKLPFDIKLVNSNAGKNVFQGVGSIFHTGETDAGETDAPPLDTTPGVEPSTTPLT